MVTGDVTRVVNTQYNIQMMDYRVVHPKPINVINLCHASKFNKNQTKNRQGSRGK